MRLLILGAFIIALALLIDLVAFHRHSARGSGRLMTKDTCRKLGIVNIGTSVPFAFEMINVGNDVIRINTVHPSCGCTIVSFDTNLVGPGKKVVIKARFNTKGKALGPFAKSITVITDSRSQPVTVLKFSGTLASSAFHRSPAMAEIKGIFSQNCKSCHLEPGIGKFGIELWKADCAVCHKDQGGNATELREMEFSELGRANFERITREGVRGRNMPAFSSSRGGPLSDRQISSLVRFFENSKIN